MTGFSELGASLFRNNDRHKFQRRKLNDSHLVKGVRKSYQLLKYNKLSEEEFAVFKRRQERERKRELFKYIMLLIITLGGISIITLLAYKTFIL